MTLKKAKELLAVQAGFGGYYNATSAKLCVAEPSRNRGRSAVDRLIRELALERVFGFGPGRTSWAGSPSKPSHDNGRLVPRRQQENPDRARGSVGKSTRGVSACLIA